NATGWPFGGPWVNEEDASKSVYCKTYSLNGGQTLKAPVRYEQEALVCTAKRTLNWTAPDGQWTLYAVFAGLHGKLVERAAPGGEGYAIDHFSEQAAANYFKRFDDAFKGVDLSYLRAFFNDSYEVDDARGQGNWTSLFFEEFKKRRRYDLKEYLPAL